MLVGSWNIWFLPRFQVVSFAHLDVAWCQMKFLFPFSVFIWRGQQTIYLPVASKGLFFWTKRHCHCLAYTIKPGKALEPFTVLDREPGTCCLTSLHTESIAPVCPTPPHPTPPKHERSISVASQVKQHTWTLLHPPPHPTPRHHQQNLKIGSGKPPASINYTNIA